MDRTWKTRCFLLGLYLSRRSIDAALGERAGASFFIEVDRQHDHGEYRGNVNVGRPIRLAYPSYRVLCTADLAARTENVLTKLKRNEKNGIVEITIEAYNQNGVLVLKDVTEAIVKSFQQ